MYFINPKIVDVSAFHYAKNDTIIEDFMEDITMAMTNRNTAKLDCMIYYTLDELVPQDHLIRKMEEALDFRFIYPKVQHLYSCHGRPSIDPVVLFKMLIINIVFGINSMRKTC